ncbi:MAG: efflux transporter outer membrane subunit [Acidobacteriota bacterium]
MRGLTSSAVVRNGLTLVLLGLGTGCASAPPVVDPNREIDPPAAWTAADPSEAAPGETASSDADASASEVDTNKPWWTSFGVTDLDAILEEALEHNHDLRAAAAAVDAAVAQARIAGATLKPQVSAGLDAARRQQVFVGLPIPGQSGPLKSLSSSYGASLNVSWEPDLWGRLRAGRAAAQSDAEAARADYEAARLSLAGQAAKAWFSVTEAEHQVQLATETLASRTSTADRIAARYRRGVTSPLDLRLARSNRAQAEASLELRKRGLDATRRQLEVLLGRYPSGRVGSETDAPLIELPKVPAAIPVGLPAELVTRRPDLLASEDRLAAAGLRVKEARRALYPRLTLTGSGGTSSDSLSDLVDGDFSVWNLAGSLLQPLFQGGRLRAAVELAEASQERILAQHVQGVLRAFAEVETALAAERLLAAEEAAQATATEEAKAASRLAEDRYLAGVGDYLTILESQRQAFSNESRLLTVRNQRLSNRVDLHLALGGDFGAATQSATESVSETANPSGTATSDPTEPTEPSAASSSSAQEGR